MNKVKIELQNHDFFCPATGAQILDEESFNPSKAQLFCYIEGEGYFEYIHEVIKPVLIDLGVNLDVDYIYIELEVYKDFLVAMSKLMEFNNSIIFSIFYSGISCGPVSTTAHHCIDMDYMEE